MPLITDEYIKLVAHLHSINPLYGATGHKYKDKIIDKLYLKEGDTLLDYGCGKASLKRELSSEGITVYCYDPAIKLYNKHPREEGRFKNAVCINVLEHVEPDCITDVLDDLSLRATRFFIVLSTRGSTVKLKDGRNSHLLIKPLTTWIDMLSEHGFIFEESEEIETGVYLILCRVPALK